jgi:hypothetical protein
MTPESEIALYKKLLTVWDEKQQEWNEKMREKHEAGMTLLARVQQLESFVSLVINSDCILGSDTEKLDELKRRANNAMPRK